MAVKPYIFLALSILCGSCVEPFEPVLEESQEVLVISGMISDSPGRHIVTVSLSSNYRLPTFQGVESCVVNVTDQDGNMIHYMDEGEGVYAAQVPETFLEVGDAASLYVFSPDRGEYRSTYDTILPCPELDSVYWELQYTPTSDPEKSQPGVQFYLDMSGSPSDSRNLIWQVNETWEIWAALFGNVIMQDWRQREEFDSNAIFKCWQSFPLDNIYTKSTRSLSSNELRRMPLTFVSNETNRLQVTYSLNVKQQSLTMDAYNYWQRMNEQAVESDGLYSTQPASVAGNIYPVDDSEEEVLGYFYASQVREKRTFVHNNNLFEFFIPHIECEYQSTSTLRRTENIKFPVYLYERPFTPTVWGPKECFDCRLEGGDTIRPVNWETWP